MKRSPSGVSPQRILFVSQLFDPEPTFKGWKFAQALTQRGFSVEVITGFPNYPGGQLYPGYRIRPITREQRGDVKVTRLAIYPYHGRNVLLRALCYLSFFFSSALYLVLRSRRSDIIYVFYPAITAGFSALVAKLIRGPRVVIDIQDLWPDSLLATGVLKNRLIRNLLGLVSRIQYKSADRLVGLSQGFRDIMISRGAAPEKVKVIYNWADETVAADGLQPEGYGPGEHFRALFAGNMGAAQGLPALIEAASLVQNVRPDVVFYFMGAGIDVEPLKQQAARMTRNVRFLPRVPLEQVQGYLKSADCLLITLKPDDLFSITIPSKTQAYLFAGRPIMIAVPGEAAEMVRAAGAGVSAIPGDAADIAAAIVRLRDMNPDERARMGARGQSFYASNLAFDTGVAAFVKLFQELERTAPAARSTASKPAC